MQKTLSRLTPVVLLLALLLLPGGVQAVEPYDVVVTSDTFEPGHAVKVEIAGLINQTFSIRITDVNGDILSGRDAQLNATGKYIYSWNPSSEGTFNATVTFSTGIIITKSFLVQEKVTDADIAQLYYALFGIRDRLTAEIEALKTMLNYVIAAVAFALLLAIGLTFYVRTLPRKKSELEIWIQSYVKSALEMKLSEQAPKEK